MENRYVHEIRLNHVLDEVKQLFTYSAPDAVRKLEHGRLNTAFLEMAETIRKICPDSRQTEMAIEYLWVARACANGSLATYESDEADK